MLHPTFVQVKNLPANQCFKFPLKQPPRDFISFPIFYGFFLARCPDSAPPATPQHPSRETSGQSTPGPPPGVSPQRPALSPVQPSSNGPSSSSGPAPPL